MIENELRIVRLPHGEGLALPAYESMQAAGLDLCAACPQDAPIILQPGERVLVPTAMIIEITPGHEAQIRPRSGLAIKHGITCLNSPGTIDADYRGEVKVILINHSKEDFTITRGMRIAQMVIAPVTRVVVTQKQSASSTKRGSSGFGSTGI